MFFIIKKKSVLIIIFVIVGLSILFSFASIYTNSMPKAEFTIVIDAGHGGVDVKLGQYVF